MKRVISVLLLLAGGVSLFGAPKEIVFCAYNVRNYVNAAPAGPGQKYGTKAKPTAEIEALIRVIREINPDILGVCEMGTPDRFDDFKKRLKEAGLGYVDSEYVQGPDPERRLALVSRFPIVARQSVPDQSFELNGRREKVRRGFLDVTIAVHPGYQLRAVGVHFKSKLPVPEGEALIRRYEAQKLRQHLDKILAADRRVNLIAYGDFNDTKNEPMFAEVSGVKGSPSYMADLWAKDTLGDRWTHYWKVADQYARLDYLFVSPALFREVVLKKSFVYRSPFWDEASDHRPIFTSIIPLNRE
ncbi:MAG: endonuclease/exonuclease/phosphatase family protein [Verrucomicrobiota bacterium]|nr:endonuclease/exonuclease/phosphatase family protein [Verrucomicrobiota bacterium]